MALVACLLIASTASAGPATNVIDDPAYTHPQRMVEVEPGRKLNLYCIGTGSPTVIFDSGLGGDTSAWALVQPKISTHARACSFDRAGLGFSDAGRRPGDSANIVDDLHHLLVAAGIKPPYILVGHSFGGMNVRLYADRHFDEVVGMVLVDTADEDWLDYAWTLDPEQHSREHLYAAVQQGWQQDRDCVAAAEKGLVEGTEVFKRCVPAVDPRYSPAINAAWLQQNRSVDHLRAVLSEEESLRTKSDDEVRSARRWFGNLPLIVLKSSLITKLGTGETQAHRDAINHLHLWLIDQYAALSTRGVVRIVPDSTHDIPMSQPEAVNAAILEVLDASTSGK
jgi:pimeloyl-ACP methyl ester carboxylesterase